MATLPDVLNSIASLLAQIPQYVGVVGFDDAIKTNILAGKMAGRFTPPNPFNNNAGNAVNTPALFIAWLREIYRAVKLGSAQASMRALMSDKFLSIDTPETYEKRIRPC
ncbi:3175_t:CDS:2, partial [Funneliformis geosporum]